MATGTTEFIDHTTADVFLPEIWSQENLIAREEVLLFAKLFDRRFEKDVMRYGDTIHVPNVSNLAAQTKTLSSNAAVSYETVTETDVDVTIGTWEYSGIAVETALARQANRDFLSLYAPKQGYALGLAADTALAGLPDNFSQAVGTLAVENTYEEVLRAIQYLDDANVPTDDRHLVVSPAGKHGFMKLDYFIHSDYSKLNESSKAGQTRDRFGSFMGIPCYASTNVEGTNAAGHDGAVFHRQVACFILQMKPTTHQMFDIDYLVDKVVVENLYGSSEMRDDHGVWLKGA